MTQFSFQEWAVKPKLNILVRLQGLPKKTGWTCGFLCLHTRLDAVLSNAFQEAFATATVSAAGSAEGDRVLHPPTTPLAMSMDSPTVRVEHVLHLNHCPSFTSAQEESSQQPINPFQAHMCSHMCSLVA